MKIFDDPSETEDNEGTPAVKEKGKSKVTLRKEGQELMGKQTIGERKPSQMNPLDKEGNVTICHECDSTKQFYQDVQIECH